MKSLLLLLTSAISFLSAQTLTFSITNGGLNYSITCATPTLEITASSSYSGAVNYTWSSSSFTAPVMANSISIISPGSYSVAASSGTALATQSFVVGTNTTIPVSTGSPSFLVTGSSPQTLTFSAISPTSNVTHYIYSPFGGTFTANSPTVIYVPGGSGVYRYCMVNEVNGCSTTCLSANDVGVGSPGTFAGILEYTHETFLLFPNPSDGLFTLITKFHQKNTVEVYTNIGVLVSKSELGTDERMIIDIREKPSGIYLVKLTDSNGKPKYLKLLKE
ncbi:T9SS type A sorting domain-containing protein [Aurantibacillus circumpalustris]|uniref:T9SS type A sorting domain-containing protein n=1 Tax=Aurantibacillus circumpalustris TaxID=3036359 RepID=UPI00295AD3CC|nr:T9SS type A sorting domain-containing protein [Aurantibacillus circumpalustris]